MKRLMILLGSLCLALMLVVPLVVACAAPEPAPTPTPSPLPTVEKITWTWQRLYPWTDPMGPYGPYAMFLTRTYGFADWIEEATDGRLTIEFLEPSAVFPQEEALENVGSGIVDMATANAGYWSGAMPEMDIETGMPGTWENIGQFLDAEYVYGINELIQPLYEPYNVYWLTSPGFEVMNFMATFPMPDSDSIKGHKLRSFGPWLKYIGMLEGAPVSLPYGEVYMATKLGTIEGVFTGVQILEEHKYKELATHMVTNPNPCADCVLINKDSMDALPDDIREMILREYKYHFVYHAHEVLQQQEYTWRQAAKEMGITAWTWSDEDLTKVRGMCMEEIWPEFASKTPLCNQLVEIIKQQFRDLGKL